MVVMGGLIKIFDKGYQAVNMPNFIFSFVSIIIGILIVSFTKRTVKVQSETRFNDYKGNDRPINY
jgi:hypothetical protein